MALVNHFDVSSSPFATDALRLASAIGHITPPVGLCLFVGMAISRLPMEKLARPLLPFLAAIVAVLLFLAFVPEIVLYLPRAFGFTR